MFWLTTFLFLAILILLNGLYVAAEFSTISARKSRLSQLAEDGSATAATLLAIVEHPKALDAYVATCQVGITVSSLVLGYYGQARLSGILINLFEQFEQISRIAAESISTSIVLIGLTIVQVLIGELVPKNIGLQYPERLALLTALPMQWSEWLFKPLIVLFNGSGTLIMRLFGLEAHAEHSHIHSPDEITMLAAESRAGGILKSEEHRLLRNTLQMRASIVRHVMIPRPRMLAGSSLLSPAKMLMQLADSPFSRIPIYEGTIDNVVGVVHLRDLLCAVTSGSQETVAQLSHNVPFIPETMSVRDAFTLLQKKQFQVAIVLDEFGGTAGMISLEDILEQIFGDLEDEFDAPSPAFRLGAGRRVWIRGEARIAEVNEMLGINLPERDLETLGGLILNRVGHIPIQKETFEIDGVEIRVEEMSGRGIGMVSLGANEEQYRKVQALLNT